MDCNNQVSRSAYCCPHCGNTRVSEQIKNAEYLSEVAERKKNEESRAKIFYNGNVDELRKVENETEKKAEEKKRRKENLIKWIAVLIKWGFTILATLWLFEKL